MEKEEPLLRQIRAKIEAINMELLPCGFEVSLRHKYDNYDIQIIDRKKREVVETSISNLPVKDTYLYLNGMQDGIIAMVYRCRTKK